jgi:hypothetical protein
MAERSPQTPLDCPPERCIPIEQLNTSLGFTLLEPETVPEDFVLESRKVFENSGPGAPQPGAVGPSDVLAPPSSVLMEFRFRGSPAIPGITLIETSLEPGDPETLSLQAANCAEEVDAGDGQTFYINGTYTLSVAPDESTHVLCKDPNGSGDFHSIVAKRGNVLIEVVAFPEVRITKEEIIEFVKSLRPAESDAPPD